MVQTEILNMDSCQEMWLLVDYVEIYKQLQ